jgi:hypothetical protein
LAKKVKIAEKSIKMILLRVNTSINQVWMGDYAI